MEGLSLTGPRLRTLAEAAAELSAAVGRKVHYTQLTAEEYASELVTYGLSEEEAAPFAELIAEVLDGRNSYLTDGVQRAIGRRRVTSLTTLGTRAASGVWNLEGEAP